MNYVQDCPACNAKPLSRPYFQSKDWKVLRCSSCTFAWVVDIYNPHNDTAFKWGEDVVEEAQKRTTMYKDRLRRVENYSPSPRRWLDIGCGGGGLLSCAADGHYRVEGIELSPSADYVADRYGIPIHKMELVDAIPHLQFQEYGVISYFHVLEHVMDPRAELLVARKLLGENSILVIEVPFFDTFWWRLLRSHHRHFYRGHRSYFNKKSLIELLRRTGFEIIKWESVPYQMTLDWLLMRLGNWASPVRRLLPQKAAKLNISINIGEYLLVLAKKAKA